MSVSHFHVSLKLGESVLGAKLADSLRRESSLDVVPLSTADYVRLDIFPTLLQVDEDIHGSHGLFYWLRTRGAGVSVRNIALPPSLRGVLIWGVWWCCVRWVIWTQ